MHLQKLLGPSVCRTTAGGAPDVAPALGIAQQSQLPDRPPSLLPFPIGGRGQPLFSLESTTSHTDQVLVDEDSEEAQ